MKGLPGEWIQVSSHIWQTGPQQGPEKEEAVTGAECVLAAEVKIS